MIQFGRPFLNQCIIYSGSEKDRFLTRVPKSGFSERGFETRCHFKSSSWKGNPVDDKRGIGRSSAFFILPLIELGKIAYIEPDAISLLAVVDFERMLGDQERK